MGKGILRAVVLLPNSDLASQPVSQASLVQSLISRTENSKVSGSKRGRDAHNKATYVATKATISQTGSLEGGMHHRDRHSYSYRLTRCGYTPSRTGLVGHLFCPRDATVVLEHKHMITGEARRESSYRSDEMF